MSREKIAVIEIKDTLDNRCEMLVFIDGRNFLEYVLRGKRNHTPLSISNLQIGWKEDVDLPIKYDEKTFVKDVTTAINSGVKTVYNVVM